MKKLGLKKNQYFFFNNQKTPAKYYFNNDYTIIKDMNGVKKESGVSFNYICKITKDDIYRMWVVE